MFMFRQRNAGKGHSVKRADKVAVFECVGDKLTNETCVRENINRIYFGECTLNY